MYTKIKFGFLAFSLLFISSSCSNDIEVTIDNKEIVNEALQLRFEGVSDYISQYTEVYAFNGQGSNLNGYNHKPLNIDRTEDHLKMDMPVGKWNLVLVGCDDKDIRSSLLAPVFTQQRSQTKMWENQPVDDLLPDAPEIRTALVDGVTIVRDESTNADASLERNVAKIRVNLKDGIGFKVGGGHTVSLLNVPTCLSWSGGLYPNGVNPTTSSVPMTKSTTLHNSTTQSGHQQSDTVEFIIPAHKASLSENATTHKISVGVKFITLGGNEYINQVEIPIVPQPNTIMDVNLTSKLAIEVAISIRRWDQTWSQTDLINSKIATLHRAASHSTEYIEGLEIKVIQERNWWVTIEDNTNFEIIEGSETFGNKTESAIVQVRRKTNQSNTTTRFSLYVSGFIYPVESRNISSSIKYDPNYN